ncbi:transporter substrate-binding domain-containing protein [Hyphomicrobium sp. CS1GBMeth3]|uniref:transporter substrate-binding domain-containing protein n=1 Tax=Hyphomicrobium sp. CS1GBMeth3 TaxID=1892845 RepID=UPI0009313E77|nr:transporter substrate-binding domain-containing protein [Hyphomicrobium sp. CS1GBMeth3]
MQICTLRAACIAIVALLALGASAPTEAQQTGQSSPPTKPDTLRVGLYVSPPFVMKDGGRYTGMAIELWEMLAQKLVLHFDYVEFGTVGEIADAAAEGTIDVAVTNLTITRSRAQRIDFTHPWFDAGLRVMVNSDQSTSFGDVFTGLEQSGHLRAYAWIAAVILFATVLLTAIDRHFDRDFPRRWRDGIGESFYTVMSVATSGKPPARKNLFGWIGRIWQGIWLVSGVAVLAYATSSVTSVMTTLAMSNQINSVADLDGRRVGVFTGSVAESYARESDLDGRAFPNIEKAVAALLEGRIAAVIGDAPVLEYHAHTSPHLPVAVVGAIFEPDKYGFGLPRGSALTRPFTVELIGAHESGMIEQIRRKYFGEAS